MFRDGQLAERGMLFTEEEVLAKLIALPARERILWVNANLTYLSRDIFHQCVTVPSEASERMLQNLKKCFWVFAAETTTLLYDSEVIDENIFPTVLIAGLFNILEREMGQAMFERFLAFNMNYEDMLGLHGFLAHLKTRDLFLERTTSALEKVKQVYQEGGFRYFFGNVSVGNFAAAFLARQCGADIDQFRLYQYSRKAIIEGETLGLRTLESELGGIDRGVCIVDGFCMGGRSIEESIKEFKRRTGVPLYVFISYGHYPMILSSDIKLEQLYPPEFILLVRV